MCRRERHPVHHRVELPIPEQTRDAFGIVPDVAAQSGCAVGHAQPARLTPGQDEQLDAALEGYSRATRADDAGAADEEDSHDRAHYSPRI
jgi:hypothetical protein